MNMHVIYINVNFRHQSYILVVANKENSAFKLLEIFREPTVTARQT